MRHPITQARNSATTPATATDGADRPRAAQPARALRLASSAVSRSALPAITAAAIAPPAAAAATPPAPRLPAAANISECQPVAVRTTHGKRMEAYCRLSRIDNGTVACLHTNTAKLAKCRFTPSSGRWLESKRGALYAMVGQAISRNGKPGGGYTIAAKLGKDGRPPCVKDSGGLRASAADSAGTAASQELPGGGCVTEVMGSASNVTGFRLENYATREVCTSSYPHPDGAPVVRRGADGSYCYLGRAAALNDRYGTERNSMNVYFREEKYCHVIWSSGAEVPAAKRPATTTYPAPGRVQTNTPIVWRPVSSVPIAN